MGKESEKFELIKNRIIKEDYALYEQEATLAQKFGDKIGAGIFWAIKASNRTNKQLAYLDVRYSAILLGIKIPAEIEKEYTKLNGDVGVKWLHYIKGD